MVPDTLAKRFFFSKYSIGDFNNIYNNDNSIKSNFEFPLRKEGGGSGFKNEFSNTICHDGPLPPPQKNCTLLFRRLDMRIYLKHFFLTKTKFPRPNDYRRSFIFARQDHRGPQKKKSLRHSGIGRGMPTAM